MKTRTATSLLAAAALSSSAAVFGSPIAQQLPFSVDGVASFTGYRNAPAVHGLNIPSLDKLSLLLDDNLHSQLTAHVAAYPERRIVALLDSDGQVVQLDITEGEKALLVYAGIKFDDVTESTALPVETAAPSAKALDAVSGDSPFPSKWAHGHKELEKDFYNHIDKDRIMQRLRKFTSFRTRYYRSSEGKASQKWLLDTVKSVAAQEPSLHIHVEEFPHPWGQNSIIARLPLANSSAHSLGKVIIGAHQDSTNLLPFLGAPGADDDASGSITVLEVLSTMVQAKWRPESYEVEFHWYSAEEGGMLGSNAVAASYASKMRDGSDSDTVRAMLQMDMTAYVKPGTEERIGIIGDYVDPALTDYVKRLTSEYTGIPAVDTKCGYSCSDHSSWTKIGVPSAFAIEATFEDSNTGAIHSGRDTVDLEGYSLDHLTQFVRLSTAFAVELSS